MVTHDHEEAFAVADRLAVMRGGRIVQQGEISEVWRAPADPETALFLGYARVLRRRRRCDPAASPPACRRRPRSPYDAPRSPSSAGGPLGGVVVSGRATPEQIRLVVDVDGIGEVDAVARLGTHPAPGDRVALSVDPSRLAAIPAETPSVPD